MLDDLIRSLLVGTTLIEDRYGAVNRVLAKQISEFASSSGKSVCFLAQSGNASLKEEFSPGFTELTENMENTGGSQSNSVVFNAEEKYIPLEKLNFDVVVFQSFSSYLFGRSEQEVVTAIQEITNLVADGKRCFVLTSETGMLSKRINGYLRASVDNLVIVRSDIVQNRINRMLFIPKLKGGKQYDQLLKITMEEDRVEVDTREFVG